MIEQTKIEIRRFLGQDLGLDVGDLADDAALFSSGRVDSMSLIELFAFIESDLGVPVGLSDLSMDNFDSIEAIAGYVVERR
jgi:acyl carrier protein